MEYGPDFTTKFMNRTLAIAQQDHEYDATLLVNCLLGLLIVPKESLIEKIPTDPFEKLSEWGIDPKSIKKFGKCDHGETHTPNLPQLVRRLRNAVAHFKITPFPATGDVAGFSFMDRNGFRAELSLKEMKDFVTKLAEHLKADSPPPMV